jgi:hypothetical protein
MQSRVPKIVASQSLLSDVFSTMNSQFLVVSNYLSNISGIDSDILSVVRGNSDYLSKMSDVLSNAYSAAAVGASRTLLVQSRLSDLDVRLVSDLSDIYSAAGQTNSRALVIQSRVSDVQSALTENNSATSDIYSLLSDLHSDVTVLSGITSDAHSAATAVKTKTDQLTFTQAGQVDANVQRINDVAITGDGSGTPFNVV